MSSFVYFKFKSQKDPTRVTIDGPHTDVWNLKREIINISRLGDGTDFDLKIYKENTEEEYTDDTEIIPKDSTVLARRLPATAPGKGRAARYVSGKPPASARPSAAAKSNTAAIMDSAMTEEERLKAMLKMTDAQWQQKQEEMSHDTRINVAGAKPFSKKANIPEGEPPHGYVCYRCMQKGHWIQACPTNDDAAYDGKPRVKKTTGIPRSMLQKVDKSEIDNLDESQRQNVMVTSDGEYVLAQADKKTWKKFQDQKIALDQAQQQVKGGNQDLQDRGLECPIDKRLFVDPRKTPCCGKTYCFECIENALIESDLECPNCHTQNVSLERLEPDEEIKTKIEEYQQEKKQAGEGASASVSGTPQPEQANSPARARDGSKSPKSPGSVAGRKRSASETNDNQGDSLTAPAPSMKRQKSGDSGSQSPYSPIVQQPTASNPNNNVMPMADMQSWMQQMQMPNMGFPQMPFMPNMPMSMPMPMNPMMNPMMGMSMPMNMPMSMMNGMNGMNGMMPTFNDFQPNNMMSMNNNNNFNQTNNHASGGGNWQNQRGGRGNYNRFNNKKHVPYNKNSNNNYSAPQQQQQTQQGVVNAPKGPKAMAGGPPTGVPTGPAAANKFSNQQRHQGKEEDNAYMRQPVNPQRAMNRNRGKQGMRTAEYKEL